MAESLAAYNEIADVLRNLPLICREKRRARKLSLRAAASEIGVDASLLFRLEAGHEIRMSGAIAVLDWLAQ